MVKSFEGFGVAALPRGLSIGPFTIPGVRSSATLLSCISAVAARDRKRKTREKHDAGNDAMGNVSGLLLGLGLRRVVGSAIDFGSDGFARADPDR
jgi:hypothetical protein